MEKIRWGIISTGNIARKFAKGLQYLSDAEIAAVGSRTSESANWFADLFGIPHRHASYEALAHDPSVDVVYVATPHTFHKENSLLCLRAGKAVLCEKPFTINASEAEEVIRFARDKKLFLMEAMWTRFFPLIEKLRQILTDGVIGELKIITADFGIRRNFNPKHRLFNPGLGGGALLDVGIYPVSLASMFLGTPKRITSIANLSETGVDEQAAILLGYDEGQLAVLYTAVSTETPVEMILIGTEGRIRIHSPMYVPTGFTLSLCGKKDESTRVPLEGNGYNYEAAEVMRCLREGKLESEIMPLNETLSVMKTMDQIRAQWGLKYPMEL